MGLYRSSAGPLTGEQLGGCLILTDAATVFLLDDAGGDVTRGHSGVNGSATDSELLSDTFVDLADTMVADFDIIDFLHMLTDRSVRLLAASAAGVVLADPRSEPRIAAASSEAVELIELFQIQNDQGPCLDCFRTGQPVTAPDLSGPQQRWTEFAAAAVQAGFHTVEALPMRLRGQIIGALNLFRSVAGPFEPADLPWTRHSRCCASTPGRTTSGSPTPRATSWTARRLTSRPSPEIDLLGP